MEYAKYGSLLDLMAKKKVLNESEARMYFHQLINALTFCHTKLIAHRDLKLENLLLVRENCLKIGDFGFARKCDDPTMTYSLTFCGSNAYISPEIIHLEPYNPYSKFSFLSQKFPEFLVIFISNSRFASDVWASGVILFAMVSYFIKYQL